MYVKKTASIVIVACALFIASNVYCAAKKELSMKGPSLKDYKVSIDLTETVRGLKTEIEKSFGFPFDAQIIMVFGEQLENNWVIQDILPKLNAAETIHLIIREPKEAGQQQVQPILPPACKPVVVPRVTAEERMRRQEEVVGQPALYRVGQKIRIDDRIVGRGCIMGIDRETGLYTVEIITPIDFSQADIDRMQ